ncbi:hypothetical protein [Actinokineospora enzanensis]|uniref:hypothetical protein n=1 Tax=Actinokineospora enzanensis TaxID=155975 RepID=UPI000379D25F|nr:hypothetical protein [Actinokineospora enzanensis]
MTPTTDDARKAGGQAVAVVHTAIEQARTPLLAALGAGDLAARAVLDAVTRARGRAEATRSELPTDLTGLRERLDPAELRRLLDEYTAAAVRLYQQLADHGEDALGKLREQPQVKKLEEVVEEAIAAAQSRVGGAAGDARTLAEEVLAKVTGKTRAAGEQVATAAQDVAADVAETVLDAGDQVAEKAKAGADKVADQADKSAPTRKPAARTGVNTRKPAAKPTED